MLNTIDMHCDTIMKIYQSKQNGSAEYLRSNTFQIDRKKLKKGEYLLQNFALFMDKKETADPYKTCKEMIACFYEEMEKNQDWIKPVKSYADIQANQNDNLMSALLTMEEGAPVCGDLKKLEEFYQEGVRMMTLTWNYLNEIGFPNAAFFNEETQTLTTAQQGLTEQGTAIVQRMEQLGMIIDVSHGSDQLVEDVLTHTKKPFVASHSNARAVCSHFRNLPDPLIKKIAERGGVIGINYFDLFLKEENRFVSLTDAFIAHVNHFHTIGGIDCIGLGSDFDGIPVSSELPDASSVTKLYQALDQAGYSSGEVEKIFTGNVLRLYKECL
ncbi:dipeptidase [Enterococcus sp. BWB1-3]|uniref:dipeptidase n=1 Tax=unclassified Enterococcus TaxID=2608891 RepID=UPI001922294D|nr:MULTISPECIES: dipeptidase [unclassified Enterococcus]MBL1229333.1 dipeptidase [Enterococcus sp. BWB1-3]MCB5951260.1 dipeptidase [Enterococcus sp. BWT-B8]MCB5956126.1 dipeptidase [Enterococcus sp. CWB-B31]